MNKERVKNCILIGLVLLSFVLTNQLWLNIPISGIIPENQAFTGQDHKEEYDLSNFVLPQYIIINFGGQSHTRLINDSANGEIFGDIYEEVSGVLKQIFEKDQDIPIVPVQREEWLQARESKSVEANYRWPYDTAIFKKVLGTGKGRENIPFQGIKSLLISLGSDGAIYLDDGTTEGIYKSELPDMHMPLNLLADRLEEQNPVKYWTLSEIGYSEENNFYVPIDMSSFNLPVGTAVKELDTGIQAVLDAQASSFFSDMSMVRKITEMNDSYIYTDSQTGLLKIDNLGLLEYMVYSHADNGRGSIDTVSAIEAALRFINAHGGMPEQSYIEEIRDIVENDREGLMIRFNYAYDGLPFFRKNDPGAGALEVVVVEGRVVRYTRCIHKITKAKIVQKPLLYPVEAADAVVEAISGPGKEKKLLVICDMYLGYCIDMEEFKEHRVFPVWYIKTEDLTFIVDAYEGRIVR